MNGYLRVTAHKQGEVSITRRVEIDGTVTRTLATLRANGWYVDRWEHVEPKAERENPTGGCQFDGGGE